MEANQHRTWAEISLRAIEHNYQVICDWAKSPVMAVVKANAYGHGAVPVAKRLEKMGAPYFAVATMSEAIELRENGIKVPIIILGYIDAADMDEAVKQHITAPIYDRETAELLSAAAVRAGQQLTVHFKLDTGMTRLGFPSWECQQTVAEILSLAHLPGLQAEGIFTHFAVADVPSGTSYTDLQYRRFKDVCDGLAAGGLNLPLRHCANSGAIQHHQKMHCTMARAGIILYGYRPDASVPPVLDLHPAMTVKARVIQVRDIPAETTISYGRTYETREATRVAVLSMGYADGYFRTASGKAHVLMDGIKTPVLGRICMDMCMAQIPDGVTVRRGDEVIIFGTDKLTADDVADAAGTISYEVLCAMSHRVPRFYLD